MDLMSFADSPMGWTIAGLVYLGILVLCWAHGRKTRNSKDGDDDFFTITPPGTSFGLIYHDRNVYARGYDIQLHRLKAHRDVIEICSVTDDRDYADYRTNHEYAVTLWETAEKWERQRCKNYRGLPGPDVFYPLLPSKQNKGTS